MLLRASATHGERTYVSGECWLQSALPWGDTSLELAYASGAWRDPLRRHSRTLAQTTRVPLAPSSSGNQRDTTQEKERHRDNQKSAVRRPAERSRPAEDFTLGTRVVVYPTRDRIGEHGSCKAHRRRRHKDDRADDQRPEESVAWLRLRHSPEPRHSGDRSLVPLKGKFVLGGLIALMTTVRAALNASGFARRSGLFDSHDRRSSSRALHEGVAEPALVGQTC